jgi:rhamnulokinase
MNYLACDLGAESGRLMLGSLAGGRLLLNEIHRFPNQALKTNDGLHWNIPQLFGELKTGLTKAAQCEQRIASISTDSWGLDYMLFAEDGALIPPTFHYRDMRTVKGVTEVKAQVESETIFAETGIQFMPMNTIYQLAAESQERLARAERLLLIGDGFNFLLSGVAKAEESLASTSQLYNPRAKAWSKRLLHAMNLAVRLFPQIVPSGTRLGPLKEELVRETGLASMDVIASCSHDTGAAVAAVPARGKDWAYLSSGTWSLMGVERSSPILTDACRERNFTNEIGFAGSVRFLKNIVGLWIVQECRRAWAKGGQEFDYATLTRMAAAAAPFISMIDPADARFLSPDNMPAKIEEFCRETGQAVPATPGATIRCVLESLALLYRRTLLQIEELTGRRIERLHIVGGGSQNALLSQFTASALQIPVWTGPVEATAAGNILIQAITLGDLPSLEAAREVVSASNNITVVQPDDTSLWEAKYERFEALHASTSGRNHL